MEFTEEVYYETMLWINDDDNNTDDIATENAFDFLNNTDKLCTPGFILRRELKRLVIEKEKAITLNISVENLQTDTNEMLPDDIADSLSFELAKAFKDYGISPEQWSSYLKDEYFCNRKNAVKIILAFGMDDEITQKFLLANGHNLFSLRNPFDYICVFCKKCGFSFKEAQDMLKLFEEEASKLSPCAVAEKANPTDMTIALKNETENISGDTTIKDDNEKKTRLIKYMLQNRSEFVEKVERKDRQGQVHRVEYPSGFSLRKIEMLKLFAEYLAALYPTFMKSSMKNEEWHLIEKSVTTSQGELTTYNQLKTAIYQIYGLDAIDLDFDDYRLENINVKKVAAIAYRNAFNSSVVLPLKNMPQNLRAIMRSEKKPNNAQDVDRSTIILLTYFFIDGCRCAIRKKKLPDKLTVESLESIINKTSSVAETNLLTALKEIIDKVRDLLETPATANEPFPNPKPLDTYIDALNLMLMCFDFSACYLPFMLDRFILLCLMKDFVNYEDERQYLIKAVLQLAKDRTDEKINSALQEIHDG